MREFDPLRLDIEAFARAGASLDGQWPLQRFERLADLAHPQTPPAAADRVDWKTSGEWRARRGGEGQCWLHLNAGTRLSMQCQRCLEPVEVVLDIDRHFLFVRGEDAAAQLDADSDDDVLALNRAFDLAELVEDELLLALPLVPRHADCAPPLALTEGLAEEAVPADEPPHPFAALASLKRGRAAN